MIFHMDPDNVVIESDDQFMVGSDIDANTLRVPLSVKEGDGFDPIPWIAFTILIAALISGILIYAIIKLRSGRDH
jgi:hypothetical protein